MSAKADEVKQTINLYTSADKEVKDDEALDVTGAPSDENADPLVMPNLVSKKPGMLRTKGNLTLHTRSAHQLFYGRKKDEKKKIKPITGLVRFALNMNQLYDLAAKDDPYADSVLISVEEKLEEVSVTIKNHIKELEEQLADMEGITIDSHESVQPISVPLEFRTTYGFIAAQLIGKYDKLIRLAQCAMHVTGTFLQSDWERVVRKSGSNIRNAFWQSSRYRYTGVTRNDIAANNPIARNAIEKYGELPQEILEGTKRGKYAPKILGTKNSEG